VRLRGRAPGRRERRRRRGRTPGAAGGGRRRPEARHVRELRSGAGAGRHAADAHRLLALLDLDLGDARLFEELDQLLYLSDVHAAHALRKNRRLRKCAPAQGERASLAAAARTAASSPQTPRPVSTQATKTATEEGRRNHTRAQDQDAST